MSNKFYASVAMYLRKSRAEEGEDTEVVLARHRLQLTQFAEAHCINISRVYEEVVSGDSLFARPQMIELLNGIEAGRYSGVLCTDIDRLGRGNMKEQGLILETLKNSDTAIITPDKIYDLNNELDETQSEFKTFMARQELKMIKKRLSRGIHLTIEKGGYISNVPFGYKRAYQNKTPTLVPDPDESKIVQLIFKLYNEGKGCQEICNMLNSMGVQPHRSDKFSRSSIRKIITNPVYIGKVVWGQKKHIRPNKLGGKNRIIYNPKEEWYIFKGLHPPIIDEDTFKKANSLLSSKSHPPYRKSDEILNPFSGLLFCRRCGKAMTRRVLGSAKTEYLLCPTPGCMKSSRLLYIEQAVISELRLQFVDIKLNDKSIDDPENSCDIEAAKRFKNQLKKLKKQRDRLCDLLEQGIYSTDVFSKRSNLLSEEIDYISAKLKELTENKFERSISVPSVSNVLQEYWSGTPAEKNLLLKHLIKKAYYYKPKNAGPKSFVIDIELKNM